MENIVLTDIKGSTTSLDPRSKIITTLFLILGTAISLDYFQIFLYLLFYFPILILFKPRMIFLKRILFPMIIISIVAIFLYLGIQTETVKIDILGYKRPYSKIEFVGLIVYRYLVIILYNYMLLHSEQSHSDIIEALASFRLGTTLITILLLIKRISTTITADYHKMMMAAQAKGAFGINPIRNIFIQLRIVGRTFAKTISHSETISKSLTARGFHDQFVPTIRPWTSEGITVATLAFILFVNITLIPWMRLV